MEQSLLDAEFLKEFLTTNCGWRGRATSQVTSKQHFSFRCDSYIVFAMFCKS